MKYCAILLMLSLAACNFSRPQPDTSQALLPRELWQQFAVRFIEDGRVVDRDNGGISHSEGQGYGMLLAEAAADRSVFERLWQWTRGHLAREDGLLSWRWEPARGVTDRNNATDGDILVAWALLRAAQRWQDDAYHRAALSLIRAVREQLLVRREGRIYLLPGVEGFETPEQLLLNPSYYVFPALAAFAAEGDTKIWQEVRDTGLTLIQEAAIPPSSLVPDWVSLSDDGVKPADEFPPRFSWNAVRVPLHLAWSGSLSPALLTPYVRFWQQGGDVPPPAWIDLMTGETAGFAAPTGIQAIIVLVDATVSGASTPPELPAPTADDGYFSTSLALLSRLAAHKRQEN